MTMKIATLAFMLTLCTFAFALPRENEANSVPPTAKVAIQKAETKTHAKALEDLEHAVHQHVKKNADLALTVEDSLIEVDDVVPESDLVEVDAGGRRRKGGIGKAVKSVSKAAKKAAKKAAEEAKKRAEAAAKKALKTATATAKKAVKSATSTIKKIGKGAQKYAKTIKKIASSMSAQTTSLLGVATDLGRSISFGCDKQINLKLPKINDVDINIKTGKISFGNVKMPICTKPSFQVAGKSGNAALAEVKDMVVGEIQNVAELLAEKAGLYKPSELELVQTSTGSKQKAGSINFHAHKSGMLLGPKCTGQTWAITATLSFGASVGVNAVGASVGFELGVEFGCMKGIPNSYSTTGSKRIVMVPVWGIGAGLSGGAVSNGVAIDFNVGYATTYEFYKAGGLPGGISVGGSVSAGKVGIAASASFGVPPLYMVTETKKFNIAGKEVKLIFPKAPFIKSTFGGVGLTFPVASFPPAMVPYNMLQLHTEDAKTPVHEIKGVNYRSDDATAAELLQTKKTEFTMDLGWSLGCRRWDNKVGQCFEATTICINNCA